MACSTAGLVVAVAGGDGKPAVLKLLPLLLARQIDGDGAATARRLRADTGTGTEHPRASWRET
jgi:hypothetical protein